MNFIYFTGALAILLSCLELKLHYLPLALAASVSWLAVSAGVLLGASPSFDMGNTWTIMLATVLVLRAFVPAGHFISQMGKTEITITDKEGKTYKMWGHPTKYPIMSRSAKVQTDYAKRMHSVVGSLPPPQKFRRGR